MTTYGSLRRRGDGPRRSFAPLRLGWRRRLADAQDQVAQDCENQTDPPDYQPADVLGDDRTRPPNHVDDPPTEEEKQERDGAQSTDRVPDDEAGRPPGGRLHLARGPGQQQDH